MPAKLQKSFGKHGLRPRSTSGIPFGAEEGDETEGSEKEERQNMTH